MANEFAVNFQEALKAKRRGMGAGNRTRTKNYKPKTWLYPWAHERKYKNFLLNEFSKPLSRFTLNELTDKIPRWKKEVNQDRALPDITQLLQTKSEMYDDFGNKYNIYVNPGNGQEYLGRYVKEDTGNIFSGMILRLIRKDDYIDEFNQFINDLKQEANNILGDDDNIEQTIFFASLLGIAEGIFSFNNSQWKKQTEQVLGFEYTTDDSFWQETRRQWANENYGHLQGYSEEHRRRIREAVNRGIRQNISTKEIMDEIKNINDWKDNKVELLARDQTGKLNGIITKRRMQEVGISAYTWITANDERVRPKHKTMNGKIMNFDNDYDYTTENLIIRNEAGNIIDMNWVPRTGDMESGVIPGEAIQCRCQAIPYWEPVIQQVDREAAG